MVDNPAFAYVIEAASGISWLTRLPRPQSLRVPYSVGDPNAGVHALNALLLALEHRRRTGQGVHIEAAMVDAALNVAAEQVIEYSAYGALLQRDGNRGPDSGAPKPIPHQRDRRVRPSRLLGGRCRRHRRAVDGPVRRAGTARLGDRPRRWSTADGRRSAPRSASTSNSAPGAKSARGDDIVAALWSHGVPVAKVMQPHRQSELPQP